MDIKKRVSELQDELIDLRRYFHQNPEKSWEEFNTQKVIIKYLEDLKIPYIKSNKTGVIATINGKKSTNKIIGIRAEIDALKLQELGTCSYKSDNDGLMHACGHDAHMAILLITAKILKEIEDDLDIAVKLIFQPAEECIEDSGATYVKDEEEVLDCDRLIALHIWSRLKSGYASLRSGPIMASADTFDIYIKGKGGHGALPHETIDPIVVGADIINNIQRIVSREVNPQDTSVVSITSFNSGSSTNIIPSTAHLKGTTRTFNNNLRREYPIIIERICKGIAEATRTEIELLFHPGPPPMVNDEVCTQTGLMAAEKVFGKDYLVEYELQMSGEDFAKYKNEKCLLLLGGGFQKEEKRFPQHSPYFDIDESSLKLGVEYFIEYILEYQKEY